MDHKVEIERLRTLNATLADSQNARSPLTCLEVSYLIGRVETCERTLINSLLLGQSHAYNAILIELELYVDELRRKVVKLQEDAVKR